MQAGQRREADASQMQAVLPDLAAAPAASAQPPPPSGRKKTPSAHMGGGMGGMPAGSVNLSGRISPIGGFGSGPSNFRCGALAAVQSPSCLLCAGFALHVLGSCA